MTINAKLKKYMDDNGLKYGFIAQKAGINQKKFSRLINGKTKLTVEELEVICRDGLSVDPAVFLKK